MDASGLAAIAQRHRVQLVLQHGSTVAGTAGSHSDLDLALLLERMPQSSDNYLDLLSELQRLFSGREVDVILLNHADPLLLKRVMDRSWLLYGSAMVFRDLRLYAFKRFQDHRRFLAMERDYVRRKIASAAR